MTLLKNLLLAPLMASALAQVVLAKEPHVLEYERKNPVVFEMLRLAEAGDVDRQYVLGFIYTTLKDESGPRWYRRAYEGYVKRAEKGDPEAMYKVGVMHFDGTGVSKDLRKAAEWYQKAADRDHQEAQQQLAGMYQFGDGVEADEDKAFYWMSRAASQNKP